MHTRRIVQIISIPFILIVILVIAGLAYISFGASGISQGIPIPEYYTEKSALIVVNIQEVTTGTSSENESYIAQSEGLINTINSLTKSAYFHNIPVIYVKNEISDRFINLINNSMEKGSPGVQFDKRLQLVSENIISKEKQDAFSNYKLDSILNHHKVNKLYVVGLDAAFCVNRTVRAAINRKYKVCILEDALISETEELKKQMIDQFSSRGAERLSSSEFLEILDQY